MKNIKTLLRISGILLFLRTALFILLGVLFCFDELEIGIVFLGLALFYAVMPTILFVLLRDDNRLIRRKTWVLVFAILSIFQNLL